MNDSANTIHPCCLTIAGSDSGGNAGVQADLRAFHAYGLHGCTVFAALTAQNPFGVSAIHPVPADFVAAQLDAVLGTYAIKALKTGMLSDPEAVEAIAERLKRHPEIGKVIDPVMVATSGARLIGEGSVKAITEKLMPLATLITPNLPEAEFLCGNAIKPNAQRAGDAKHAEELAKRLYGKFGCAVLVKGGHGNGGEAVDVLYDGKAPALSLWTGCESPSRRTARAALWRRPWRRKSRSGRHWTKRLRARRIMCTRP